MALILPPSDALDDQAMEPLLGMGKDFIDELAGDLMSKLADEVSAMRRAIDNQDPHLLQKIAHGLKGAASYLALSGLRARVEHIELCGRAGRLVGLDEVHTLMAAAQANLAALKARIPA